MGALARVPIRWRLVLAFTLVMAAVLAATGAFIYLRLGAALDEALDRGLRGRADDVAALVRQGEPGLGAGSGGRLAARGESFAQVLSADGAVVDSTPQLAGRPLLDAGEVARAARGLIWVDRALPGLDDSARLLAAPVDVEGERLVVVVGASLEGRAEALESLLTQLLIGGPLALLVSALAAYWLATAALRPVESMRREAEAVSAVEPGRRLPLAPAQDEIRRLGETINGMLGRLEVAFQRERRFVADASHELRTPLAALRMDLELALRRKRTETELEEALRSAAEETERLSQLAEDLLVLARAQGGRLPVRREAVRAVELLVGVRERFARRSQVAGREIEIRADEGLELRVDRLRAEQALGNLLENALQHAGRHIVLEAAGTDGGVELHVRDDGPGFPEEFISRAFEPFSRGSPVRSGGAGLGLTIVQVLAAAHGGAAHVQAGDGWTDVWLEFPDGPD
jgi:signal transduction histidine kinase